MAAPSRCERMIAGGRDAGCGRAHSIFVACRAVGGHGYRNGLPGAGDAAGQLPRGIAGTGHEAHQRAKAFRRGCPKKVESWDRRFEPDAKLRKTISSMERLRDCWREKRLRSDVHAITGSQ